MLVNSHIHPESNVTFWTSRIYISKYRNWKTFSRKINVKDIHSADFKLHIFEFKVKTFLLAYSYKGLKLCSYHPYVLYEIAPVTILGSLRNDDGDAVDNVG